MQSKLDPQENVNWELLDSNGKRTSAEKIARTAESNVFVLIIPVCKLKND